VDPWTRERLGGPAFPVLKPQGKRVVELHLRGSHRTRLLNDKTQGFPGSCEADPVFTFLGPI